MKVKTSEVQGIALDWLVALIEKPKLSSARLSYIMSHYDYLQLQHGLSYHPSSNWGQGGPIIERECITLRVCPIVKTWRAFIDTPNAGKFSFNSQSANSPLIAAMRCYVASKLGDVIDIPDELMESLK